MYRMVSWRGSSRRGGLTAAAGDGAAPSGVSSAASTADDGVSRLEEHRARRERGAGAQGWPERRDRRRWRWRRAMAPAFGSGMER
jgi:hypothetical protein